MTVVTWTSVRSPLGNVILAATPEGLCCVTWAEPVDAAGGFAAYFGHACQRHGVGDIRLEENPAAMQRYVCEFDEYFAGSRLGFSFSRAPLWGTEFQRRVWSALRDIPYGETWSYGELARRLGNPKAVRAVGRANGANPIPIVTPCHRVIGGNGKLVGFASGLDRKEWLLNLEGALPVSDATERLAAAR